MRRFFFLAVAAQFLLVACTCERTPVAPSLKKIGEACSTDDSCETGLCDAIPGVQAVCVKKCADTCATDEICTQLTPDRFSCAKDPRKLCQSCTLDSDCPYPSDKCVVVNQEKVCGRDCAFDQNCPSGYSCRNALGIDGKAKLQQCTPTVASCACLQRGDLSQPCTVTNSVGTCGGIKTCDLVSNTVTCSAQVPSTEACNGIDDNCNGTVDEIADEKSCGKGACKRTVNTCSAGKESMCVPGMPIDELCNGIDDDCDDEIDEIFPVQSDPVNCGACGFSCIGRVLHATPIKCGSGKCDYDVCDPDWVDADGDRTNGCEHSCGGDDRPDYEPGADAGTFRDLNCDDFDGDPAKGIFVATAGDDANEGTKAKPKKTIQAALAAANLAAKHDIFVAAGTYTGPVEIGSASDLIVAGGYHPTTWKRAINNLTIVTGSNPALTIDNSIDIGIQLIKFTGVAATAADPDFTAYGAKVTESSNIRFTGVSVTAGAGFNGAVGAAGTPGANGGSGGAGGGAKIVDDRLTLEGLACNAVNNGKPPEVGQAGTSACGAAGGYGGAANKQTGTYPGSSPGPGGSGGSAPGGAFGGVGVSTGTTPSQVNFGSDGSIGADGAAATTATPAGSLSATGWTRGNGASGQPGTSGKGGGGGGGGTGGWQVYIVNYTCQSYGAPGGGGGAGGCGGGGGQGGLGGGASIGLFVSNSSLTGFANSATAGKGGDGGNGGAGGSAGDGGPGGVPAIPDVDFYVTTAATQGGKGGSGGKGGVGGQGSGGAGGSAIAIAKSSSSSVPAGTFSTTFGAAGAGGSGSLAGPAGTRQGELTF